MAARVNYFLGIDIWNPELTTEHLKMFHLKLSHKMEKKTFK